MVFLDEIFKIEKSFSLWVSCFLVIFHGVFIKVYIYGWFKELLNIDDISH